MIKFNIENNLSFDILYQSDGYILLDTLQNLIQKENELRDMKNKLMKMKNNMGINDINELDDKFQNIMRDNNNAMKEGNNNKNNVENQESKQ